MFATCYFLLFSTIRVGADVAKTGMLATAEIVRVVAERRASLPATSRPALVCWVLNLVCSEYFGFFFPGPRSLLKNLMRFSIMRFSMYTFKCIKVFLAFASYVLLA